MSNFGSVGGGSYRAGGGGWGEDEGGGIVDFGESSGGGAGVGGVVGRPCVAEGRMKASGHGGVAEVNLRTAVSHW